MGTPFYNPTPVNSGFMASFIVPNRLRLFAFAAYNSSAVASYILVFDAVSTPANGAVPLMVFPIGAKAALNPPVTFDEGRLFTNGMCFVLSSTDTSLTIAGATMVVDVVAS